MQWHQYMNTRKIWGKIIPKIIAIDYLPASKQWIANEMIN